MKKLALVAFLFGMFGLMTAVRAADKDDPTGTWKFKVKFGEKEFDQTVKLELKDGKLTGSMPGFGKNAKDTPIEDGKFKDGELSFSVTRTRGKDKDMKIVTKYSGKVSGDTIKGTITRPDQDGKDVKTDWEAKKEAKKD
jgi:hypothetical protein